MKVVLLVVAVALIGFYFLSDVAAGLFRPSTRTGGVRPFILHLAVQVDGHRRYIAYGAYQTESECMSEGRRLIKRAVHPAFRCSAQ